MRVVYVSDVDAYCGYKRLKEYKTTKFIVGHHVCDGYYIYTTEGYNLYACLWKVEL